MVHVICDICYVLNNLYLGMSWAKRKIAAKLTPTIIFSFPNDDTLKIEFTTTVMSRVQEYKINGVTKHKGNYSYYTSHII